MRNGSEGQSIDKMHVMLCLRIYTDLLCARTQCTLMTILSGMTSWH